MAFGQIGGGGGGGGSGDVTGPASSTDNALARFNGTTGKVIQNSNATLSDAGDLTLTNPLAVASGGSGRASHTAYAVVCGGTTTTGAQQSIASVGTAGQVLTSNGAGTLPTFQATVSSLPPKTYWFAAESLQPLESNFAPLDKLVGTNVNVFVRSFDDTTEEYVNGKIQVPNDLDTSGTVTFRCYVSAATAAASKNVGMTFGHLALADSEDWDPASPYTDEDSGAVAISATQDDVTLVEWTETVSNLGWASDDLILFRLSRDPGVTDDLTGDLYVFSLSIDIPRA